MTLDDLELVYVRIFSEFRQLYPSSDPLTCSR